MWLADWSAPAFLSAAFFGAWFAFSLIGQLWPRDSWIRRGSISWLVPDWRFFAPEPGVKDFVVVYRSKTRAGQLSALKEIAPAPSGALRWLWNPETRRRKALFDLTDSVHLMAERLSKCGPPQLHGSLPDTVTLTAPYLALLNLVSGRVGGSVPRLVQFGIIHRGWPDHEELAFLSRWHAVGKSG